MQLFDAPRSLGHLRDGVPGDPDLQPLWQWRPRLTFDVGQHPDVSTFEVFPRCAHQETGLRRDDNIHRER
jgi:hypothetical protein